VDFHKAVPPTDTLPHRPNGLADQRFVATRSQAADDGAPAVWGSLPRSRQPRNDTTLHACTAAHIPIIDADHRPTGVLNACDLLEVLLEEVENEEALLRGDVMGMGYH